jgi:hypothetical protein
MVQPVAHGRAQQRRQRRDRMLEDADAVAAAIGLFLEQAGALQAPCSSESCARRAIAARTLEARERLQEEFAHALAAARIVGGQRAARARASCRSPR